MDQVYNLIKSQLSFTQQTQLGLYISSGNYEGAINYVFGIIKNKILNREIDFDQIKSVEPLIKQYIPGDNGNKLLGILGNLDANKLSDQDYINDQINQLKPIINKLINEIDIKSLITQYFKKGGKSKKRKHSKKRKTIKKKKTKRSKK